MWLLGEISEKYLPNDSSRKVVNNIYVGSILKKNVFVLKSVFRNSRDAISDVHKRSEYEPFVCVREVLLRDLISALYRDNIIIFMSKNV